MLTAKDGEIIASKLSAFIKEISQTQGCDCQNQREGSWPLQYPAR